MPKAPVLEKLDTHVANQDIHGNMPNHNTATDAHANLFAPVNASITILQGLVDDLHDADDSFSSTVSTMQNTLSALSNTSNNLQVAVAKLMSGDGEFLIKDIQTVLVRQDGNRNGYVPYLANTPNMNTDLFPVYGLTCGYNVRSPEQFSFVWREGGTQGRIIYERSNGNGSEYDAATFIFPQTGYYLYLPDRTYYPLIGSDSFGVSFITQTSYKSGNTLIQTDKSGFVIVRKHGPNYVVQQTRPTVPEAPSS
jgi:hypothetical protein